MLRLRRATMPRPHCHAQAHARGSWPWQSPARDRPPQNLSTNMEHFGHRILIGVSMPLKLGSFALLLAHKIRGVVRVASAFVLCNLRIWTKRTCHLNALARV